MSKLATRYLPLGSDYYRRQRSWAKVMTPAPHQSRHPAEQTPPRSRQPPLGADSPQSRHPPEQTPPWSRHHPLQSRHPPWEQTAPQSRHPQSRHPPEQTPPGADTPGADTHPQSRHPLEQTPPSPRSRHPSRSRLQHTVNKRPVSILLECILVFQ